MKHRAALRAIRFPQKLWMLVNSSENEILEWARNGTAVILDISALEEYLLGADSVFLTRSVHTFVRQLSLYGFQRCGRHKGGGAWTSRNACVGTPTLELLVYRNEHFKRDRPQLLDKVVRLAYGSMPAKNGILVDQWRALKAPMCNIRLRCREDAELCRQIVTKVGHTCLQQARIRLRSLLSAKMLQSVINRKVASCDDGSGGNVAIELSMDLFENAADSASSFEQTDVAGYYGNVQRSAIQMFFGEYLPTYSNEDGTTPPAMQDNSLVATMENSSMTHIQSPENANVHVIPSIPNYQIIANNPQDSSSPYSIQIINNPQDAGGLTGDSPLQPNRFGQLTGINYAEGETGPCDPSSVTKRQNSAVTRPGSNEDEFILSTFGDEEANTTDAEDEFEIDKWLTMHETSHVQHDDSDDKNTYDVPYDLENPFKTEPETATDKVVTVTASETCDPPTTRSEDDFFAQIRESMDILYADTYNS